MLTALKLADNNNPKNPRWLFKCDCGNETVKSKYSVANNRTRSCGCIQAVKNITGIKYGMLTAIKYIETRKWKAHYWLFKCDCGETCVKSKRDVLIGRTRSCGCLGRKMLFNGDIRRTHNLSKTRFYKIWNCMKNRTRNKSHQAFKNYGGRGIKILWQSFDEFRVDMYKSYLNHVDVFGEKQTSIDRKNNDGNYCKENCRWATRKEQANNTRKTKRLLCLN